MMTLIRRQARKEQLADATQKSFIHSPRMSIRLFAVRAAGSPTGGDSVKKTKTTALGAISGTRISLIPQASQAAGALSFARPLASLFLKASKVFCNRAPGMWKSNRGGHPQKKDHEAICASLAVNDKTVPAACLLFLPEEHVRHHDNVTGTDAGRHHPYRQSTSAKQGYSHHQQDDVHPTLALIMRQVRKQQLASMSYKIFSHSYRVVR